MNWEEDKIIMVSLYYDCINKNNQELFTQLNKHRERADGIYRIVSFIHDRLSAVWFLTMNDLPWDADIIDRSALEALIKLIFIVNAPNEFEQQQRLNEYWNDLWEINSIKRSEHAKSHLIHFKDTLSQLTHLSFLLPEKTEIEFKQKWNRKDRKMLEQKWSFSEMLFNLAKNYKGKPFDMLVGLAHEYRMCSHISHGDETGVGIISERKTRPTLDRETVERGHFIKLMSNCLVFSNWLSITVMDYLKEDYSFYFKNFARIEEIKEIERLYQQELFNDPLYDKYKQ